jgi:hypothetical protein
MIKKLIFGVFLFAFLSPARGQVINTYFSQKWLSDIIVMDSSLISVHFIGSGDTTDHLNTKGKMVLYKFDLNLNRVDSIVLDSLNIGKCIERNGNIFIAAPRSYPDTLTCSINLFHLNKNLDILNYREFKEVDVNFEPSDLMYRNDSLYISVTEYRIYGAQQSLVKEFRIDTTFIDMDTVSCSIIENSYMYSVNKNSILVNNKRIYSGDLNTGMFFQPVYNVFSESGTCNQFAPYPTWLNYIFNESNLELMAGNSNYLLQNNHSFFVSIAGEENFGSFDSFTGVLKTDTSFNLIDYYVHQPTVLEENLIPFRNKSISRYTDKIILASNTKMEALMPQFSSPYEQNEIRIDVLDTNLNFISGINLDPITGIEVTYIGIIIEMLPDGGILLGGGYIPQSPSEPAKTFLIKYSSLSELLGVSEENSEWNSLILYPNPAIDILKIENNFLFENSEVKFYDVTGKLILSKVFNENGFSIEDFSDGIYFIQINTEKGNFSGKFIKE